MQWGLWKDRVLPSHKLQRIKDFLNLFNHRLFNVLVIWLRLIKSICFSEIHGHLGLILSQYSAEFIQQVCQMLIIWLADAGNIIEWRLLMYFVKAYLGKYSQPMIYLLGIRLLRGETIVTLFLLFCWRWWLLEILLNLSKGKPLRSIRPYCLFNVGSILRLYKILIIHNLKLA